MEPLTANQNKALALLATGQSVEEISNLLGIHRSTLWRWRQDPQFIAEWNKLIYETKEVQERALLEMQAKAIGALGDCLNSRNEMVKLRASLTILEKVQGLKVGATNPKQVLQIKENAKQLDDILNCI